MPRPVISVLGALALSASICGLAPSAGAEAPSARSALQLLAGDTDGDGSAADDCAPLDPSVHPGAVDHPDVGFTDTNCDGIDGDVTKAVFVSLGGNDAATGTRENPFRTITTGVTAAAAAGKDDVYVAGGTYAETAQLANGVGVYGGYAPITWARSDAEDTTIQGAPAALAVGDVGVVLQQLTLSGLVDGAGNSYGLRAVNGPAGASDPSQVALESVAVRAADGANGAGGGNGFGGSLGTGLSGGAGGAGGCGDGVLGSPGLPGAGPGGQPGSVGPNGILSTPDAATWPRAFAASGTSGGSGMGGTGGRGGTGAINFGILVCGGTGGAGGRGGGGGAAGAGGQAGGGSFGIYNLNSNVVVVDSPVAAGKGGNGGNGGQGGPGGSGAPGAAGLPGQCVTVFFTVCGGSGNPGGGGFSGGPGGGGGGAVGGPSAAVYQGGAASGFTPKGSSTLSAAAGGIGGRQAATGPQAPAGLSRQVLRTSTAPITSTYDFDGDAINDTADVCPTLKRGVADHDGDGCPEAPSTSITSGPAANSFVLSNAARVGFTSDESGSTFACSLDGGDAAACTSPRSLSGLSSRTHLFRVWATDPAGDADPTAAARAFTVPRNNTALSQSTGWQRRTGAGYFLNSFSTSTRRGATLSTNATGLRKIALVATRAPGQGKVSVFLGSAKLKTVSLASASTHKKQLIAIGSFSSPRSGKVRIVVATAGKPVRIEGLGLATG